MVSYYRARPEFGVNTRKTGNQTAPTVSTFADGGFVILWGSDDPAQDGDRSAIKGQLFDSNGDMVGAEFLVNTSAAGYQFTASVATLASGAFIVTWVTNVSNNGTDGIKARLFARDGTPLTNEFLVHAPSTGSHFTPNVAALANGGFVISWDDWANFDVKAQMFDAAAGKVGAEFTVNTRTDYSQEYGDITALANGGFVATWRTTDSNQDGSGQAVKAQIFDSSGAKVGAEFLVNSLKTGDQYQSSIAALSSGGFVITWYTLDTAQDGSNSAIKAQIFSASGAKVGGEFLVNTQAFDGQNDPSVTGLGDGGFMITWTTFDTAQDGSSFAIKAQVFSATGAKVGGEFLVNSITSGAQTLADIATMNDGRVIVTWVSATGDGNGNAVRAQIFEPNARPVIVSNGGGTSAGLTIDEGETAITTVVATDSGGGGPIRYSISGPDAALFAIDPVTGVLKLIAPPDYEAPADFAGDNFYNVTVTASDGELSSWQAISVLIRNVNEPVTITSAGGANSVAVSIAENQTAVATVTAVDADGTPVTYSIAGGADAAFFAVDAVSGALSFIEGADFEAQGDADGDNVYEVVVAADDGSLSDSQAYSVTVADVDEPLHFTSFNGDFYVDVAIGENGLGVGVAAAEDPEGAPVTYAVVDGYDGAHFTIDAQTGALRFVAAPDFEAPADNDGDNVYIVLVSATDGTFFDYQTISVHVGDVYEPVAFAAPGRAFSTAENGTAVGAVAASAEPGRTIVYSIAGGADAARFTIDAVSGTLSFVAAPNYEQAADSNGDNVYELVVAAADGAGSATQNVTVTVGNVEEGVVIGSFGGSAAVALTRPENDAAVGQVQAADGDGDSVAYAIVGGADAALFRIDAATGTLSFIAAPNYEAPADSDHDNVYKVEVAASSGSSTATQAFSVHVGDVYEPVAFAAAGRSFSTAENATAVGAVAASAEPGRTIVYSIAGGADAARFTIDAVSGALSFVSAPNYEQAADSNGDNVYELVVAAADGAGSATQNVTVTVGNVEEGVVIGSFGGSAAVALTRPENDAAVGQVQAADGDGDTVAYAIVGGADAALFRIDAATGTLSFIAAPNYEAPADSDHDNVYKVEVAAGAGASSATQAFSVTVANVNEALVITSNGGGSSAAITVGENGRGVAAVVASDPDGSPATYSIVGGADAARFTINAQSGVLQFIAPPDYELPSDANGDNVYSVIVQASDGLFTDTQALTVSVANLRDGATVNGTSGNDSISGTSTNAALRTTNSEDTVFAGGGHDTILGLAGDDHLFGDAGNDDLTGGAGADRLTGGLGKDLFVYALVSDSTPGARDVITDFSRAQGDRISLSDIDANSLVAGNQAFTFIGSAAFSNVAGQLRFETSGGVTLVSGDVNGDGVADFQIELTGAITPVASDFVL